MRAIAAQIEAVSRLVMSCCIVPCLLVLASPPVSYLCGLEKVGVPCIYAQRALSAEPPTRQPLPPEAFICKGYSPCLNTCMDCAVSDRLSLKHKTSTLFEMRT